MNRNIETNEKYKTHSYHELSAECRHVIVISWLLVEQMYYRLTRVDGLRYRKAVSTIYNDHKDLFSRKTLVRHIPKDDPTVERRIRTKCLKESSNEHKRAPKVSTTEYHQLLRMGLLSEVEMKNIFDAFLKLTQAALADVRNHEEMHMIVESYHRKIAGFALEQVVERDKAFEKLLRYNTLEKQEIEANNSINATFRQFEMQSMAIDKKLMDLLLRAQRFVAQ